MTPIFKLPSEILFDIFSLAIRKSRIPPLILTVEDNLQDCVLLIRISLVCRQWREVTLVHSSLWSPIYIHLEYPNADTLRQVTFFANICFARSKDLPLTCIISVLRLRDLRLALPLIQALISHEDRWSRIAITITPSCISSKSSAIRKNEESLSVQLRNAGAGLLKEFHCNIGAWLTYSLRSSLPTLSVLRLTGNKLSGFLYSVANWLPLTQNLEELELTAYNDRFSAYAAKKNEQVWKLAHLPHFVLPTLRTLNVWAPLIPYFTCPSLETYVMQKVSWQDQDLANYLEFVERSGAPPSFSSIVIRDSTSLSDIPPVRGYFLPSITELCLMSPNEHLFTMFSERSQEDGIIGFAVLPRLEHLGIAHCSNANFLPLFSALVTSLWDIGTTHRTLKSVELEQCFISSQVPELLLSPPTDGIDLTQVGEDWREIARCVNEGLSLFV
ncbi:hypothetical protein SCHPADRAFT_1000751 [Schizopora paradoxa]|uniref:F-box domain-containing protein n=1 Tax=Schizopora paradoxa TaxID=27342 RepID=A0A0H2RBB5_9AGAM|nr:hypothetical protein SCHPADRAFT_1000751 [Schizopora paradoxa]